MELRTVTDIVTEPVTLAQAKNFAKASYGTDTTEDALINSMIKAARQKCELYCDRSLASKVIEIFYHADEVSGGVELPGGPHSAMTDNYPKKIDNEGTATILVLNTDYYKRGNLFWELEFFKGGVNPWNDGALIKSSLSYDYLIRLTAGYGISGTEVLPEGYVEAILKTVAEWYAFREDYAPVLSSQVRIILDRLTGNNYL